MKSYFSFIMVLCFMLFFAIHSFADSTNENKVGFISGNKLAKYYNSFSTIHKKDGSVKENIVVDMNEIEESGAFIAYVAAVNDSFPMGSKTFCIPEHEKLIVVLFKVGDFLMKHTEAFNMDAAYIVVGSLMESYPCSEVEEVIPNLNKNKKKLEF